MKSNENSFKEHTGVKSPDYTQKRSNPMLVKTSGSRSPLGRRDDARKLNTPTSMSVNQSM